MPPETVAKVTGSSSILSNRFQYAAFILFDCRVFEPMDFEGKVNLLNPRFNLQKSCLVKKVFVKEYDGKQFVGEHKEQPSMDKKQFVDYIKMYIKLLTPSLMQSNKIFLRKNFEPATKFLPSKFNDLRLQVLC
ncbi:hypothetical protein L1987_29828 [Smallanthus sonchifolius]|uniref:Uncharacterized protein n=1 Tax=Smallanthus sonchifolius TaxID=185202 RepID=A0ACB9I2J8_9ASTR|nr:hypothetical protein L1987_29828 [Smallanthus sonchifolius]